MILLGSKVFTRDICRYTNLLVNFYHRRPIHLLHASTTRHPVGNHGIKHFKQFEYPSPESREIELWEKKPLKLIKKLSLAEVIENYLEPGVILLPIYEKGTRSLPYPKLPRFYLGKINTTKVYLPKTQKSKGRGSKEVHFKTTNDSGYITQALYRSYHFLSRSEKRTPVEIHVHTSLKKPKNISRKSHLDILERKRRKQEYIKSFKEEIINAYNFWPQTILRSMPGGASISIKPVADDAKVCWVMDIGGRERTDLFEKNKEIQFELDDEGKGVPEKDIRQRAKEDLRNIRQLLADEKKFCKTGEKNIQSNEKNTRSSNVIDSKLSSQIVNDTRKLQSNVGETTGTIDTLKPEEDVFDKSDEKIAGAAVAEKITTLSEKIDKLKRKFEDVKYNRDAFDTQVEFLRSEIESRAEVLFADDPNPRERKHHLLVRLELEKDRDRRKVNDEFETYLKRLRTLQHNLRREVKEAKAAKVKSQEDPLVARMSEKSYKGSLTLIEFSDDPNGNDEIFPPSRSIKLESRVSLPRNKRPKKPDPRNISKNKLSSASSNYGAVKDSSSGENSELDSTGSRSLIRRLPNSIPSNLSPIKASSDARDYGPAKHLQPSEDNLLDTRGSRPLIRRLQHFGPSNFSQIKASTNGQEFENFGNFPSSRRIKLDSFAAPPRAHPWKSLDLGPKNFQEDEELGAKLRSAMLGKNSSIRGRRDSILPKFIKRP
ncbi:putative Bgh-specific protein [Blumeria hordei DH14]|uniref:Putative Bgh-specific protein n=1 Tax=Blumeria graminis f. sp. hordei (strain DH14) TaxID=546991 RepID=N1JF39_BLUG1|nr:putative Bgh-specific protein [Blumeria hordei DH14]